MGLSIADVDKWNPDSLTAVGAASTARANAAAEADSALRGLTIGSTPDGSPIHNSHAYMVEKITGTGSDAQVTLRNPWNSDNENPIVTVRLGDLIGSGIPGINGHHPTNVVNIGSLG